MLGLNDDLLKRHLEGRPIRVGLIGAGQMGTDIVSEIAHMRGIEVVAVADIVADRAVQAYLIANHPAERVASVASLEEAVTARNADCLVAVDDFRTVTDLPGIDVVIEATGSPNVGAQAAVRAAAVGKHVVMMSVESDITVGPILKWYADRRGVVYTLGAGDEPVALKELYDFADALGLDVVAAGKGKNNPLDRAATPDQQAAEATRRGLTPEMLVEFVDGSKTMIEMAAVANATGLVPDVRGMHGPTTSVPDLTKVFALRDQGGILDRVGIVDYAVGSVAPGVFLITTTCHPRLRECLVLRDMGPGPNYLLFRPFHLCSMEVPLSAARAVIHQRTTMAPRSRLVAEVFATAKTDLSAGCTLDGIGGRHFYGLIDDAATASRERLLPVGLAKGAHLLRDVARHTPLTYEDVRLPDGSTVVELRRLQDLWAIGGIEDAELDERVSAAVGINPPARTEPESIAVAVGA